MDAPSLGGCPIQKKELILCFLLTCFAGNISSGSVIVTKKIFWTAGTEVKKKLYFDNISTQ